MVFDAPNPEEAEKEDRLEVYEKAVELLKNMCTDMAADSTWDDEGIRTTNIRVVDLEEQGLENVPGWQEELRVALEQLGWSEAAVKDLQVALGDDNFIQDRHEDELTLFL